MQKEKEKTAKMICYFKHLHVLHCIFKQHQIHGRVELIVALKGIGEDGPERSPVADSSVERFLTRLGKVAI